MPILLGIDTGGTYTDAVLYDEASGRVAAASKALTTRHDLAVGIRGAAASVLEGSGVDPATIALVSLSTTLATNALVEGQGGRVGLVLIGFDEAAASRGGIAEALRGDPCIRIGGGHDAAGHPCEALDLAALDRALPGVADSADAFAVAGMFAVRNPEHEIVVRDRLRERTGRPVTCGHELSSRLDGPRRAMTCVLNARLVPIIQRLLEAADRSFRALGVSAPTMVVRGDGALVGAEVARLKPVETILSGPAASLVGASHLTGERDALVSDIGGTTTDYALLAGGRPRIDADGATVGGFRTMVEAVAMRTVGLGGDSEVRWEAGGGGAGGAGGAGSDQRLLIGPRRLVPLSLLATEYPDLVTNTLERQCAGPRRGGDIGRFALRVDAAGPIPSLVTGSVTDPIPDPAAGPITDPVTDPVTDLVAGSGSARNVSTPTSAVTGPIPGPAAGRVAGASSRREAMLLDRLETAPVPLDRLLESQAESGALESLIGRGLVILSGVTPSDAAHVLGIQDTWDADAARSGVSLFAEQLDSRGVAIAPDARVMSRAIVDALVERSAETLLDAACEHDGHGHADLGRHLLRAASKSPERALVGFSVRLDRPVIGLGAPAPAYYPAVAARLGTRAVVPEHAGVANAVGAVVGRVRIRATGTITMPDEGWFRVFAGAGPRDFSDPESATAYARSVLEAEAREGAADAGAGEVDMSIERHDTVAVVGGREMLVESTVTAVASGRPRFAAD